MLISTTKEIAVAGSPYVLDIYLVLYLTLLI